MRRSAIEKYWKTSLQGLFTIGGWFQPLVYHIAGAQLSGKHIPVWSWTCRWAPKRWATVCHRIFLKNIRWFATAEIICFVPLYCAIMVFFFTCYYFAAQEAHVPWAWKPRSNVAGFDGTNSTPESHPAANHKRLLVGSDGWSCAATWFFTGKP